MEISPSLKMEVETGVAWPHARECLQNLGEARKDSPRKPSVGVWPCQHLGPRFTLTEGGEEKLLFQAAHSANLL